MMFSPTLLALTLVAQCVALSGHMKDSRSRTPTSRRNSWSVRRDESQAGSATASDSEESTASSGCTNFASSTCLSPSDAPDPASSSYTTGIHTSNSTSSQSGPASGTGNFAGSNLYYAAGLSAEQRKEYLSALKDANMKVLRVWLDGQTSGSTKGTKITSFSSLEPKAIGTYDDTVLELYDDFMVDAHSYGIKLMISFHSFNALQAKDVYGSKYGTANFYTDPTAHSQFDARITHVMEHQHKTLGKQWKDLGDYIFAFETQNEAMIGNGESFIKAHQDWQCERAKTIKSELGNDSSILVTTGGASWLDESLQPEWFTCDSLDVLAIHGYGIGDFDTDKLKTYVDKAKSSNKMLIFQEWGACYFTTSNNNCPQGSPLGADERNVNVQKWATAITDAGAPWLYWQVIPNRDPHFGYDFEVGIVEDGTWAVLKKVAQAALQAPSAFDFSPYLLY